MPLLCSNSVSCSPAAPQSNIITTYSQSSQNLIATLYHIRSLLRSLRIFISNIHYCHLYPFNHFLFTIHYLTGFNSTDFL